MSKITKFNKGIIVLAAFFVITISFLFGCLQKTEVYPPADAKKLNENKVFIKLVLETTSFLEFLSQTAKTNSLKMTDVSNKLNAVRDKSLSFEDQMTEINRLFKSTVSLRLIKHMKTYNETWPLLLKTYKNISSEVLISEAAEVIYESRYSNENNMRAAMMVDCGWRYSLCIAAATMGAILCHAGCDTTALATTAGLGIPACIAACGTLQVFAGVQCYDNYCK